MADVDTPPMHEDFGRWYGAVSLGGDQPRRQARWEGVSNIVRDADRNTVEALLRLAHRSRQAPAAAVVKTVRQAFKATDEAFEMSGNDRELQILAGACLTVLMEKNKHVGAVAALSVTTAGLGGARRPDLPMDLPALGETAINRRGEINRRRPSITADLSGEPPQVDFEEVATALIEEQSSESFAAAFKLVADTTFSAIQQSAKTQATTVDRFLRIQDEELQMLWWLIGQRSSEYDCAFDAIPTDARPLVLASELARNTQFLPGPPSVMGILSRAGLKEHQEVQIAAAANAADSEWLRKSIGEVNPSFLSTPLHAAISRRLETGAGEDWVAGWAATTGVNKDHALSGLVLGNQFYRERLLLRDRVTHGG